MAFKVSSERFQPNIDELEAILCASEDYKALMKKAQKWRDVGRTTSVEEGIFLSYYLIDRIEPLVKNFGPLKMWKYGFFDEEYTDKDDTVIKMLIGRLRHGINRSYGIANRAEATQKHNIEIGYHDAGQNSPNVRIAGGLRPLQAIVETWEMKVTALAKKV